MRNEQKDIFVHPGSIVEPDVSLGEGTRVWAFTHILPGAKIGKNCNICDHPFIEGNVVIGDNVTIKSGVYIWEGTSISDNVFIGPCVAFTNDLKPRSKKYDSKFVGPQLKEGSSIGANATILPGIEIGEWAMVGAGSVVTKNVPPYSLVLGNPACFVGWICQCGERLYFKPDSEFTTCQCKKVYCLKNNVITQYQ